MKFINIVIKPRAAFFAAVILLSGQFAFAAEAPIKVNVDNFVRAETASQVDRGTEMLGHKVNTWVFHICIFS